MFKKVSLFILKTLLLTAWLTVVWMIGSSTLGPREVGAAMSPADRQFAGVALIIVSLVDTLIMAWLILRSRLHGWRLMLLVMAVYYGIKVVLSQLETWYFMSSVGPDTLRGIVMMYLPAAILYPPVAVLVWGRLKAPEIDMTDTAPNRRLVMPAGQLIAKVAALALVVYPLLFFGAGYYIAWQNPAVIAFYHGVDEGSFIAHMTATFAGDPKLYPFEVMRALLWVALAAGVIRWTRGGAWESGLLVAVLFALLMNDVHLFPNPLMPRAVSTTHFIETASSNFVWGLAITWLLHRAHQSLGDLFGGGPAKRREHTAAPA